MYIARARLRNYKSFVDSGQLDLGPRVNIICGQNNVGKTALIEGLESRMGAKPHRSPTTVPTPRSQPIPASSLEISFYVTRSELLEILRERGQQVYRLPWPAEGNRFSLTSQNEDQLQRLVDLFFAEDGFTFNLRREIGSQETWAVQQIPSFGLYPPASNRFVRFSFGFDERPVRIDVVLDGTQTDLGLELINSFIERIYRFSAERMNVGRSGFGPNTRLAPNAANLPEVLNILQGNTSMFAEFNHALHEIFPQIFQVSITPPSGNEVEIRVWTIDPALHRVDLSVPLAECGTGIGQVLAILYVALFSASSQVIIIDEPQSFLHPGATRKLMQVLEARSKHQYIITTHSPGVISSTDPSTVMLCRMDAGVSSLVRVDLDQSKDLRSYLIEVGARLSDVFGADNILWVEGLSEEICFPVILKRVGQRKLRGTIILSVSNTGDLQTGDAERILDMYNKLSERNSLLPPAVGFIFDSECRTAQQQRELMTRSHGLLTFLPRRMFESYLLNPNAIAAVVNNIPGFRETPVTVDEVAASLSGMEKGRAFSPPQNAVVSSQAWIGSTNAAEVLGNIFNQFSNTRVRFDKRKHDLLLTEWIVQNAPAELREIADLIAGRLPGADV